MREMFQALATIVMFAVIAGLAYLGWNAWTAHQRGVEAQANTEVAAKTVRSQTAAGHDAVAGVQEQAATEATIKAQTQAATVAITHAKGADAPVSRDVYYAALRAHCGMVSARGRPECASLKRPGS